jgi:hypothetical protein
MLCRKLERLKQVWKAENSENNAKTLEAIQIFWQQLKCRSSNEPNTITLVSNTS